MPDVKYEVVVEYALSGKLQQQLPQLQGGVSAFSGVLEQSRSSTNAFGGALRGAGAQVSDLGRAVSSFASGAASAFTSAVERAGDFAKSLAMVGGGAAIGAAVYGVASLNSEIEKTRIGIADILTSNGVTANLTQGLGEASDLMKQIRKDAAALPGETADLAQIFKLAAIPGLQAGASTARIEALSANTMAYGMGTAGLDSGTVSRELSMLLAGRAGAHNTLGLQLAGLGGDKAKEFNEKSGADRFAYLEKEFAKHAGSIALFADSYEGLSSTMRDNAKLALQMGTAPLFERVKGTLRDANEWFDRNKASVGVFAERLGDGLARAWDRGTQIMREWIPTLQHFAEDAYGEISGIWQRLRPDVERIGGIIKDSLGDGSALNHLESALKLYAGIKVAQGVGGALGPLASAGVSLARAGGGGGGLGTLGGALMNPVTGGLAAGGALAAGGIALGVGSAIADPMSEHHQEATMAATDFARALDAVTNDINVSIMPTLQGFAINGLHSATTFFNALDDLAHPMDWAKFQLQAFGDQLGVAQKPVSDFVRWVDGVMGLHSKNEAYSPDRDAPMDFGARTFVMRMADAMGEAQDKTNKRTKDAAHTTTIQRVDINVSSNHDPSRVAREVVAELMEMRRHPTVSRAVKNYSSVTGGG